MYIGRSFRRGWYGRGSEEGYRDHIEKSIPKGLCDKVNALGLDFGIWVEPEMVNVNSDLYRSHPEWVMEIPGKPHSEGRQQRILDFANPAVVDYITKKDKIKDLTTRGVDNKYSVFDLLERIIPIAKFVAS